MVSTPAILFANTLLLLGLTIAGWFYRSSPGARSFAALQFSSAVWVVLTIVGLSLPPGDVRVRVWGLTVALSLMVAALWIAFIFEYTGRDRWLEPRRFVPVVAPICIGAGLYAAIPTWFPLVSQSQQTVQSAGTVVVATIGPFGAAIGIYLYGLFMIGLLVVGRTALTEQRVFAGQVAALVLGTLVTVVASGARIAGIGPYPGYPLSQVALGVQSLLWGYAVLSRNLLGHVPAIARLGERTVFDDVDDGFLVTDEDGIVLRANDQSRALFETSSVVGTQLSTLFTDVDVDPGKIQAQQFSHEGRNYHLRGSAMTDWHDNVIGRAFILRDVTELLRRQQRLEVLNRVLRHNVRNEVTVIRGSAKEIESSGDGETAELGKRISEHATRLASIGEKARELQRVFDAVPPAEPFEVDSLVEELVEQLRETNPDTDLSVSTNQAEMQVNKALLTLVVEEAIENALSHTGPEPTVQVSIKQNDSDVEIVVSDDGPGIPPSELEPVRAGQETPLDHTSGLGLWLIHWGIQSLGGTVTIDSEESGTTVKLTVPAKPDRNDSAVSDPDSLAMDISIDVGDIGLDTVGSD